MVDPEKQLSAALTLVEAFEGHIAATAAYKAKAISAGFSVEAAEEMAVEFHSILLAQAAK